MAKETINVGIGPDDGTGDPLRTAMEKINSNFSEFYTAITPTGRNVGIGTTTPEARLNIVASTTAPAVRITQAGEGNALVVEDSANPDFTSFVIDKDGRVGIGKNIPTYPLDVNGDINTTSKLRFNSVSKYIAYESGAYVLPGSDLYIKGYKALTSDNYNEYAPTLTGGGASGFWQINVNNAINATNSYSNVFTIGTAANFVLNGNFGINKILPQAKLHVGGSSIVNGTLTVGNNYSVTDDNVITAYSNVGTAVYGISNTKWGVWGVSTSNTGVYGVSKTSYGVYGESNSLIGVFGISNSSAGVFGVSNTAQGIFGQSNSGAGVQGISNTNIAIYGRSTSHHGIWGETPNSSFSGVVGISYEGGIGVLALSHAGAGISAKSNTGPIAMFSNATSYGAVTITNLGTVGIGTTVPFTKLHIKGEDDNNSKVFMSGGDAGIRFFANSQIVAIDAVDGTGVSSYKPINLSGSQIKLAVGGGVAPYNTYVERVLVNGNGAVITGNTASTYGFESAMEVQQGGVGENGGQIRLFNVFPDVPFPSKYIRVNNSGWFQVVNDAYNVPILTITEGGFASIGFNSAPSIFGKLNIATNDANNVYRAYLTPEAHDCTGFLCTAANTTPNNFDYFGAWREDYGNVMRIDSIGNFNTMGNITAYVSDKRLKTDITIIPNALDKVKLISGITYKNNELAGTFGYTSQEQQVGVLAQELEAVLPEVVKLAPFDSDRKDGVYFSKSGENYKTVHYDKIVPLLIEAIKELEKRVVELENKQ